MPLNREISIRLFAEGEKHACIEVRPAACAPTTGVLIHTPNAESAKVFGDLSLTLCIDECEALGQALLDIASIMRVGVSPGR
jgi:hypothetical protein